MFEHKNHSKVFKRWYIALVILAFVVGIIAGFVFKTGGDVEISPYSYSVSVAEEKFNWVLMFSIWVSCIPLTAILYAVYSHLENQEVLINVLNEIRNKDENKRIESVTSVSSFAAMDRENDTWKCPKCGVVNILSNSSCKNCGYEDRGI